MATPSGTRRPVVSALLTVVCLAVVLRLRGPEVVHRPAVRAAGPRAHVSAPGRPPRSPAATRTPTTARPTIGSASPAPQRFRRSTAPPTSVAPRPSSKPTATPAPRSKSYTGDTYDTRYGPVQVRMTVTGSRITDVVALQLPNDRSRSREISAYAEPKLRQEALDAQSANIDTVSGATYTSDGYASSLQSAIDQWHP
jgi:uncharacterized protein with FMN-binding domain